MPLIYSHNISKFTELISVKVTSYNRYCKPPYKKHGNWYIHPELFVQENPKTTHKIIQKRSEKFKPCIYNVVVVKCTGAIFVCKWIKSIG